jgi:hypothetical protein
VLKVLKTNSHPGKKPVLNPACQITNLCPLLRGIFQASEAPTSATRKGDMQKWLKRQKKSF